MWWILLLFNLLFPMNKSISFTSVLSSMLCKDPIPKTFIFPHHGKLGYCTEISWPLFYSSTNDNSEKRIDFSVGRQIDLFSLGFGKMFVAGRTQSRLSYIPGVQGRPPWLQHDQPCGAQKWPSSAGRAPIPLAITWGHLWSGRVEVRSWQSRYGYWGGVLCPPL